MTFQDGKYRLHDKAVEWLVQRKKPFAVMACAGKFRTGKSFLLNRFLSNPPGKGFGVGETVQACTRGIWMCLKYVNNADESGTDVLVLDTEGIDALDAESEHDVKVFALAVLISSVFVYNSMSHLDEAAIQALSLMTHVVDSVRGKCDDQFAGHSPTFYWVLRDFALQLADASGNPMTHAQYLEKRAWRRARSPNAPPAKPSRTSFRNAISLRFLVLTREKLHRSSI